MELSPDDIRRQLARVDVHGWDSPAGRSLLEQLRRTVVEPVVRRSGLTGRAAEQAIASGWEASWDAVRRPSARTSENPVGMVWVAVRRAVWAEVRRGLPAPDGPTIDLVDEYPAWMDQESSASGGAPSRLGPLLEAIIDTLVDLGWERVVVVAAVEELSDHARHQVGPQGGAGRVPWRLVALRLGLPDWQVRRLAGALLGVGHHPGVLALMAESGPGVLADHGIRRVLRSTCQRTMASPAAHLSSWTSREGEDPSRDGPETPGPQANGPQAGCRPAQLSHPDEPRALLFSA